MVVFALADRPAFVLRLRTLPTTGCDPRRRTSAVPASSVIRSNQPGAYLESKATSIAAVADVILAGQFRDRVFAFDWRTVVTDRLPVLVRRA